MSYVNREQTWLSSQDKASHQDWFYFISISLFQAVVSLDGKGAAGAGTILDLQPPAPPTTHWEWLWLFEEQPGATFNVV